MLTARDFLNLCEKSPESIGQVRVILPRIGIDSHFGKFEVTYKPGHYEVNNDGITE